MHTYLAENGVAALTSQFQIAVNFTQDPQLACNAAYIGDAIVVGLCDMATPSVNFAYDSVIVMHEYTHGAVDKTSQLAMPSVDDWGLMGMPGALNEAYADFFPSTFLNDPVIGRHVAPAIGMGPSMRNLDDFHGCPDDLVGESHDDGRIWASANWAAFKASNKDPQLVKAVLEAMVSLSSTPPSLTPRPSPCRSPAPIPRACWRPSTRPTRATA